MGLVVVGWHRFLFAQRRALALASGGIGFVPVEEELWVTPESLVRADLA